MTTFKALPGRFTLSVLGVIASLAVLVLAATPATAGATEFALSRFAVGVDNANGTPDLQAGSHPYSVTNTFVLSTAESTELTKGDLKDVHLELPPGFVGDPNAVPHCSYQQFVKSSDNGPKCPNETVVGISTTYIMISGHSELFPTTDPVYNLVAPNGVAAEFGFIVAGQTPVFLDTSIRTGTDYGLDTTVPNLSQAVLIGASKVTIWGVPASPAHNAYRGTCEEELLASEDTVEGVGDGLREGEDEREGPLYTRAQRTKEGTPLGEGLPESTGDCPTQTPEVPLLTNPTSCGASRSATESVDSWQEPGLFDGSRKRTFVLAPLEGCEKLDFSPTIDVTADGSRGSTPTGLTVGLHVPQESTENPAGLGEADVKDTTVTLPAGVALSPGASDGLQACSIEQAGYTGMKELDPSSEPGVLTPQFNEKVYNPATGLDEATACPDASKIATVRIKTPLLEHELTGEVYLAAPQNFTGLQENPFSSLVAMYLVAEEPAAGVLVKITGKVIPNPVTGQLTATFDNTPALPFTDFKLEFFGTDRAPLVTPASCGTYTTEASFQPWTGTPATDASSSFNITSGPQVEGSSGPETTPCSDPLPFHPYLESGVTNINAGGYSELVTTFSREDGQQSLSSIKLQYPNGVTGLISGVKQCGEEQANAGTCGPESLIGETLVSVGLGNDPFTVTGGKVYFTGPYQGAPFGLSIVNPAKAGPFDLQEGRPIVVRAKIEVNPQTAALTVTTDPPGSAHAIPTIIDGIPLQIKHVYVNVNRPNFIINATNCEPQTITGTVDSAEGATSPVSDPFQVTNCAVLKFQPKVVVATGAHSSKADGASLNFKISYPQGAQGTQAWFNEAKFDIPKQLPARLTTLQKACLAATYETDRSACPKASMIGTAIVHTALLPVPLEGPVYFVSYGGAKFPDAVVDASGDNVHIELHGETFISNTGVTSATFRNTPDVPFESIEVNVPTGEYSEFGTNLPPKDHYDFCGQKLTMPTLFKAQNGLEIHESTPVNVTGCPKTKPVKAKKAKKHKKKTRKK
jgi:hypothetical protein